MSEPRTDSFRVTRDDLEALIGVAVTVPGCVFADGDFCEDPDGCQHDEATDVVCPDCAGAATINPSDHADDCDKRPVLERLAGCGAPEKTPLAWEIFECDADMHMQEASVEVDRNAVTMVVSQSEDDEWKWTYHVEFDGIVEPGVNVDSEDDAKKAALECAIAEVRKLLAALEASR